MNQFNVIFRKIAIETDINIKSIPSRLYTVAKNMLLLTQRSVDSEVKKYTAPSHNLLILKSACRGPLRKIHERVSNKLSLSANSRLAWLIKTCRPEENTANLDSVAHAALSRYRVLGDIDDGDLNSVDLNVFQDLDYILL